MKTTYLLATLIAATFPLSNVLAADSAKSEMAGQSEENKAAASEMKGMDMGQMMSNQEEQEAELDKLVAAMNSAPVDQKLDAIAAVLTKMVEQQKSTHEQMQKMMSDNDKEGMGMCQKMGCGASDKHSTHH